MSKITDDSSLKLERDFTITLYMHLKIMTKGMKVDAGLREKYTRGKKTVMSENRVVAAWLAAAIYQISSTDRPRI